LYFDNYKSLKIPSNVRLGFCRTFTEMESLNLSIRIKRVSMFASRKNAKLVRTELKQGLFSLCFTKKLYFNSYKHDSGIPFQLCINLTGHY